MFARILAITLLAAAHAAADESRGHPIPLRHDFDGTPLPIAFADSRRFPPPSLHDWPEPDLNRPPLAWTPWERGPYANPAGEHWVTVINGWFEDGSAAGLSQDAFLSTDRTETGRAHSGLPHRSFPGLNILEPIRADYRWRLTASRGVLQPRATMVVQSLGFGEGQFGPNRRAEVEVNNLNDIKRGYGMTQESYRTFYLSNCLFAAPAIRKNEDRDMAFISPYYLLAEGSSGSDSRLLKPIVWAAAALNPALKTRMLREGAYVPTLLWLFKSALTENGIRDTAAHRPFYALPEDADDPALAQSPFLERLITSAHNLDRIPAVTRVRVRSHDAPGFFNANVFAVFAALRRDESLEMEVELLDSWSDGGAPVQTFHHAIISGKADITPLSDDGALLRIRIPWSPSPRTDILLLADDGAPAYISVKCIQYFDGAWFNRPIP